MIAIKKEGTPIEYKLYVKERDKDEERNKQVSCDQYY